MSNSTLLRPLVLLTGLYLAIAGLMSLGCPPVGIALTIAGIALTIYQGTKVDWSNFIPSSLLR